MTVFCAGIEHLFGLRKVLEIVGNISGVHVILLGENTFEVDLHQLQLFGGEGGAGGARHGLPGRYEND